MITWSQNKISLINLECGCNKNLWCSALAIWRHKVSAAKLAPLSSLALSLLACRIAFPSVLMDTTTQNLQRHQADGHWHINPHSHAPRDTANWVCGLVGAKTCAPNTESHQNSSPEPIKNQGPAAKAFITALTLMKVIFVCQCADFVRGLGPKETCCQIWFC